MQYVSIDGGLPSPPSCPSSSGASSAQLPPPEEEEITAEGETPMPVVEESNDPVAIAARVEKPVMELVDSNVMSKECTKEQSTDQSGLASVEAPVESRGAPSTAPSVSDIKPLTPLDPVVLQVAQEESVKTPTQGRASAREAVLRPERRQELPDLSPVVSDYESTSWSK